LWARRVKATLASRAMKVEIWLDRLGLSDRPYRKTQRLVFHLYAVLLGYGLLKLMAYDPAWRFLLAQLGGEVVCGFPELALEQFPHVPS